MRRTIVFAALTIGCTRTAAPPSAPHSPAVEVAKVEQPERIRAHYRGALSSHAIDFDLPEDIELARSSSGYSWSSPEEKAALAIFSGVYPHDQLGPADDPPLAVARMVLAGVGGDVELLGERYPLAAPTPTTGTGWRIAVEEVGGWLAIWTREGTSPDNRRFHHVVFVLAMGPSDSRWSHDGAAVTTMRDSIRFTSLR